MQLWSEHLCTQALAHSLLPLSYFHSPWWDTSKDKWRRRLTCKIYTHTTYNLSAVLVVYPIWRACPTAMLSDQTTCCISYHWIWFILNLHLTKIRTPCTFPSKFSFISKSYWFIPCFLYLCCIAHHTFYTSEHRFLPLRKYQYCTSEHRSHGLSPRSCLEKTRIQRSLKCKWDALGATQALQY